MIKIPDTLQEIFDKVAIHLIKQNKRSELNGSCAYRGENGLMCAAGILIPDEEYKPKFEKQTWRNLTLTGEVENKFSNEIRRLQIIHDDTYYKNWYDSLVRFAQEYKLQVNFEKPEN